MPRFDYVEPFVAGGGGGGGEAMVEEGFYGCCFGGGWVFGDETDETTWGCVREQVRCEVGEKQGFGGKVPLGIGSSKHPLEV